MAGFRGHAACAMLAVRSVRPSTDATDYLLVISPTHPVAQLLVDMPAQSAARLLTLSLLEQLSMHALVHPGAASAANGASTNGAHDDASVRRVAAYRGSLDRLRGSITLYSDALGDSVSTKVRRQLRAITSVAHELHDVETTIAWFAAAETSGQGALTAGWLRDRLARRRNKLIERFTALRENPKPFRRLAKRLGVYTTAIRLDGVNTSETFGELTARRLIEETQPLRAAVIGIRNGDDARVLRRVHRSVAHLVHLLEPVRSRDTVERLAGLAHDLRNDVARVRAVALVGAALIEGGRRIGARQMMARVRHAIWPDAGTPTEGEGPRSTGMAKALPNELGFGLSALAERLRVESDDSFTQFASRWSADRVDELLDEVVAVATVLRDR
jgi:hypothetical protein